jgi:L-lactate dehydrogenase
VLTVSTVLSGLHGIDGAAALSVPSIISASGAHPIERTPFDDGELERLHASADALHRAAAGLRG